MSPKPDCSRNSAVQGDERKAVAKPRVEQRTDRNRHSGEQECEGSGQAGEDRFDPARPLARGAHVRLSSSDVRTPGSTGLIEMQIEAGLTRAVAIGGRAISGQRDEKHPLAIRFGPEPASELVTVHARKPDVHERDVGSGRFQQFKSMGSVVRDQDFVPGELDQESIHLTRILVVFHDQHAPSGHVRGPKRRLYLRWGLDADRLS